MLKRTTLKPKKFYSLKKSPLKVKKGATLKKTTPLKVSEGYALKKQSDKAKQQWEEARSRCLDRDGNKCIICGRKATQVHHIHLRSKRKDLLYNLNNLVSLCDLHHRHSGTENYDWQCRLIAMKRGVTVEELLKTAEQKEN